MTSLNSVLIESKLTATPKTHLYRSWRSPCHLHHRRPA